MDEASGTIDIAVPTRLDAGGMATRDGKPAPAQTIGRVAARNVRTGLFLINPLTMETHMVVDVTDGTAQVTTETGTLLVPVDDVAENMWAVR